MARFATAFLTLALVASAVSGCKIIKNPTAEEIAAA